MTEKIQRRATAAATSVLVALAAAWHDRRTEDGGLSDEVAMIAVLLIVASGIGAALLVVLTGAVESLEFGI
jgi:hypothetical protein